MPQAKRVDVITLVIKELLGSRWLDQGSRPERRTLRILRAKAQVGRLLAAAILIGNLFGVLTNVSGAPPAPVLNQYHGTEVADPFQWLENATNAEARTWSAAQDTRCRTFLEGIQLRPWVEDRLKQVLNDSSIKYYGGSWRADRLFFLKFQPPAQQAVLVTLGTVTNLASERVLVDPNKLSAQGSVTIDWYAPSLDGRLIAVSLSENGSEDGTLYIYETATGQRRSDVIPRVHGPTAGGSAAWNADSSGLFYTRYPSPGERPERDLRFYQQVYFHRLGTAVSQDRLEVGSDFPRIAEIQLQSSPDGQRILAAVANGDGGEFAFYLREPSGTWREIAGFGDKITRGQFGRDPLYVEAGKDDALYLLSFKGASFGKILRLPLNRLSLTNAPVIVPPGSSVISDFYPTASGIALKLLEGGPSEFGFFDFADRKVKKPADHSIATVEEIVVMRGDALLFRDVTYTRPDAWWQFNASHDHPKVEGTALSAKAPVEFGDIEAIRETVRSKDGTKVPLNIIRRRGTRLTGDNPVLLTGYGGYGISLEPAFDAARRVWLDQGGIIAVANVRGGGEFGEPWHQAGYLTSKQNVFDDFAACAQYLVDAKYTNPSRLAVEGRSNGGLLMGAFLTQHPQLARAVVSHVGIYDMLRAELDPNGEFNVTEYGSVRDPAQFRALYSYSPYHQITNGTAYPAVLFLSGENDGRVNPAHSRKMTAKLQAASSSTRPILLRTSASSGHGFGTAWQERVAELTDVYAFLFDQLGIAYTRILQGPWSGAVTPASATVKAVVVRPGLRARLIASDNPSFANPLYSNVAVSDANHGNVVEFQVRELRPDTQYYYAVEIEGRPEMSKRGEFKTYPAPGPASFQFEFASCARTGSTNEVFDRMREVHPLFFIHMGDFHYLDIATNSRAKYRAGYDAVLSSPEQGDFFRSTPLVYMWDDHDFGGNNSNRRASGHMAARLTYDEYVPHYPFSFREDGPICQSFSVGRVKFIITDLRSERDPANARDTIIKSMMGERQKAWFKQELLQANGKYPLICWVSTVPWIGTAGGQVYKSVRADQYGYIHHTNLVSAETIGSSSSTNRTEASTNAVATAEDHWAVYTTERREIADFIKANKIAGVCILHGDSHMLAADDGSHSDYATGGGVPLPVMCAAPMDQDPSLKGGPYSQGVYRVRKGEGCFGLITISDLGDRIDVHYSGRNNRNEEKMALHFTVPARNSQ